MAEAITEEVMLRLLKGRDGKIEKVLYPKITTGVTLTKEQIKDLLYAEFLASACQQCTDQRTILQKKICDNYPVNGGPIETMCVDISVCVFPPEKDGGNPRVFSAICDSAGTPWP